MEAMEGPGGGKVKAILGGLAAVVIGGLAYRNYSRRKAAVTQVALEEAETRRLAELDRQRAAANHAREQQEAADAERSRQRRWENLVARFGEQNARRIVDRDLWVGATTEMVLEMFGPPSDVSEKVLKTKTKRVYRYDAFGGPRGLKIKLDNDEVVGWEK